MMIRISNSRKYREVDNVVKTIGDWKLAVAKDTDSETSKKLK